LFVPASARSDHRVYGKPGAIDPIEVKRSILVLALILTRTRTGIRFARNAIGGRRCTVHEQNGRKKMNAKKTAQRKRGQSGPVSRIGIYRSDRRFQVYFAAAS
jgi:hypothetical protein